MSTAETAAAPVDYRTDPSQYKHWKLSFNGPVATLGIVAGLFANDRLRKMAGVAAWSGITVPNASNEGVPKCQTTTALNCGFSYTH